MNNTNIITAILGDRSGRIKWDAAWNLLAWLLDPKQGHGLSDAILKELTSQVFAKCLDTCEVRVEVNFGPGEDDKTKWPDLVMFFPNEANPAQVVVMDDVDVRSPNSSRKLTNLGEYDRRAKANYAGAVVKVVVITNAVADSKLANVNAALQGHLGKNDSHLSGSIDWHLITLQDIGTWTAAALKASEVDSKTRLFLRDFIEWSGAVLD